MFKMTFLTSPELGQSVAIWLDTWCPDYRVDKCPCGFYDFWEFDLYDVSVECYEKIYAFVKYHQKKGDLL